LKNGKFCREMVLEERTIIEHSFYVPSKSGHIHLDSSRADIGNAYFHMIYMAGVHLLYIYTSRMSWNLSEHNGDTLCNPNLRQHVLCRA
jgi:hypothetical protein